MSGHHIALTFLACCCLAKSVSCWSAEPTSASEPSPIPYSTVDEALKALHSKPGVVFHDEGGWIVAMDSEAGTGWLITPPSHPAYPSIVRRKIVNGPAGADMVTSVRCFAAQQVCDKFFGNK
jgi:hypothetical protein